MVYFWTSVFSSANVHQTNFIAPILIASMIWMTDCDIVDIIKQCEQQCGMDVQALMISSYEKIDITKSKCKALECIDGCSDEVLVPYPHHNALKNFCTQSKGDETALLTCLNEPEMKEAFVTCSRSCGPNVDTDSTTGLYKTLEELHGEERPLTAFDGRTTCFYEHCLLTCKDDHFLKICGNTSLQVYVGFEKVKVLFGKVVLQAMKVWTEECQSYERYSLFSSPPLPPKPPSSTTSSSAPISSTPSSSTLSSSSPTFLNFASFSLYLVGVVLAIFCFV